jgi:hypothetical protein
MVVGGETVCGAGRPGIRARCGRELRETPERGVARYATVARFQRNALNAPDQRDPHGSRLGTSPRRPWGNGPMPAPRPSENLLVHTNPGASAGILSTLDIAGVLPWGRA